MEEKDIDLYEVVEEEDSSNVLDEEGDLRDGRLRPLLDVFPPFCDRPFFLLLVTGLYSGVSPNEGSMGIL